MFDWALIVSYLIVSFCLMLYGLNCYVLIYLFKKSEKKAAAERLIILQAFDPSADNLPHVTTQIPLYNEYNVAERVIRSVCAMVYPIEKHEIQILDDSDDETAGLVDDLVRQYAEKGHRITCLRRVDRTGYKAGALQQGLIRSAGEYLAIFDGDFVPPDDFLMRTLPFFLCEKKLGLVQARWGHLNSDASMLTRTQSLGIDGHFMVEQAARNTGGLYMNFNGTAGIFRKQAIIHAGGWQHDTLTEDMDLSYRIQFEGWTSLFLPDLVVPGEIPEDIRAFKSQQFRWAKGSMETAMKLLPRILKSPIPWFKKIQAFFHLTHYMVHPLMLVLAVLALPVMTLVNRDIAPFFFVCLAMFLLLSMSAPSALYLVSRSATGGAILNTLFLIPFLIVTGTGIALSNARAVAEALMGVKSGFIRTPKKGDNQEKVYKATLPMSAVFEIALGLYCAWSFFMYLEKGRYLIGPFLAVYAVGFLFTGFLTLYHSFRA